MSRNTGIEWTDATWNPIRGCSRVSEGCRNCYAETVANRFCGPGSPYEGVVQIGAGGKGNGKWNGEIKFVEKHLLNPLRWKKPQRIFVNSMSDLFHEKATDEMLDRIFAVMALCPQHTFQVLTKRPERMVKYLDAVKRTGMLSWGFQASRALHQLTGVNDLQRDIKAAPKFPLPNVWLGVSVEDQKAADARIPLLLQTPAAVRFISYEPALGPVDLEDLSRIFPDGSEWRFGCLAANDVQLSDDPDFGGARIDWVICGGESGPGARPMHPDWARSVRDQCVAADVPFFFKQWGELAPGAQQADYSRAGKMFTRIDIAGAPSNDATRWAASDALFYRVGKKAAGNLLDGQVWQQFPR
jgi:protein gp37